QLGRGVRIGTGGALGRRAADGWGRGGRLRPAGRVRAGGLGIDEGFEAGERVDGLLGQGRDRGAGGVGGGGQPAQGVGVAQSMGGAGVGVVRAHASCTATPVNAGSTPAASIALVARLACALSSTSVGVHAECSQASLPAVRSPVSSKCATGAPAIRSRITGRTSSVIRAAVLATHDAIVPSATGAPNTSPSAAAVRALDRNWP